MVPWSDLGIDVLPTFGWWFDELSTLFFSASILIALINRMPESNYVATFLSGARDLIGVALVVAVARGIYVVMEQGVIIDTILHWAEGLVSGLSSSVFILMAYLVHIILSFFIPSTSGLATVSMPLMGPLADFSGISRDLVITAYQSASGWINLFAPTAAHLVAGLALAKIPQSLRALGAALYHRRSPHHHGCAGGRCPAARLMARIQRQITKRLPREPFS